MTIPKWLLPVLAGITAIAVGAASALIAFVLVGGAPDVEPAPEQTSEAATETVPFISPVSYGDEALSVNDTAAPETDDVSPYLGSESVPVVPLDDDGLPVGSDPASIADLVDDETLAAVETVMAAEDPASVPGIVPLFDGGDPCALPGAPSESCPEGLRSRILSLTGLPPLQLTATPSPSIGDTSVRDRLVCDPFELAEGELRLGIGTNQPASVTITYWPQGNRADARELSLVTPESQVALFEADLPSDGDPALVLKHCVVLDGLDPNARYEVRVVAETPGGDRLERTITVSLRLNLSRPPATIVPIGDNIIVVSATHRFGETLLLRSGLLDDGDDADCTDVDRLYDLELVSEPTTARTSTEWLTRNGYSIDFTERTSGAFFVPEGRNALVCLSTYDDSRPSWNLDLADYTYGTVVQAPDYTVPRVTWIGAAVRESARISELTVALGPRGGGTCATRGITVPFAPERFGSADGGVALCDALTLDGYGYANTGHLIVRAAARAGDGVKTTSAGLPLGHVRCVGLCDVLPPTSYYTVALPLVSVPSGLCGSSFGDCEPPTSAVSGGTIQLRVEWEHGARNGAQSWNMGPIVEAEGVPESFDVPQFDRTAVPRFVSNASGTFVEFDLRSDRPVNYRATLLGDCVRPDTVTIVEGRWESLLDSRVSFANPCRGATYLIAVELVDDEGRSAMYSPSTSGSIWWSYLDIPGTPTRLNVSYRVTLLDDDGRATSVSQATVMISGNRFFNDWWTRDRCVFGSEAADFDATNDRGIELPDVVPITASFTLRDGLGASMGADDDGFADCDLATPGGDTITVDTSVLLSELRSTGTYNVTAENERLRLSMTITVRD